VIAEEGPRVLGVLHVCTRNYANIEDLGFEPARQTRLFFGLLASRIVLATLRAAMDLHQMSYPSDLVRLSVAENVDFPSNAIENHTNTGEALRSWATELEASVCDALDSFEPLEVPALPGQDTFDVMELLKPDALLIDGKPISDRTVLLLDDAQYLTHSQRASLLQALARLRSPVPIWVAERFEALGVDDLLSSGAVYGRDYEIIQIEQFWRTKRKRFENLALNAGDRRARASTEVEISSLAAHLDSSLDSASWHDTFEQILGQVETRVRSDVEGQTKFEDWLRHEDLTAGTVRDRAIGWRTLEILIERERRRAQRRFDFALRADELEERTGSQVRAAAELFLARENKLPYYFGPSRLASLGSSNMEQFLWLAGDQFEELISAALLRRQVQLTPERQDQIIRHASDVFWRDIRRRAREPEMVLRLLEGVGQFCQYMTYLPNAPYDPGVTGIAISMTDRENLLNADYLRDRPQHAVVGRVLAAAIANNFLEPTLDYKCKGSMWMVLNLNRLLCPRFSLPLQYGGFKEKTLDDVSSWIKHGFHNLEKAGSLL